MNMTKGSPHPSTSLDRYSEDNLLKISRFIKSITNQIELDSLDKLTKVVKIPFSTLERGRSDGFGFSYEEAITIIRNINKINQFTLITVVNEKPYEGLTDKNDIPTSDIWFKDGTWDRSKKIRKTEALQRWLIGEGGILNVSRNDLENNLTLQLLIEAEQDPLEFLNGWRNGVEEKLVALNPKRAEQIAIGQKMLRKMEEKEAIKNEVLAEIREDYKPHHLRLMHLVAHSLEPQDVIFLAVDGYYDMPIRFAVKNKKGYSAHIKKLWNIAYIADAPGKKVAYDKRTADAINNDIFRKARVRRYMKTNGLKKPTIVKKSEDGSSLVLTHEIEVRVGLVKNDVPVQFQRQYYDKTR